MSPRRIDLRIDRLVIRGEAPDDVLVFETALAKAIENRLATAGNAPALERNRAMPYLDGGTLAAADATALGERIAQTILTGGGRR